MANKYSFSDIPLVKYRRSKFDLGHKVNTSFNMGQLVPVDIQEVLPGDTFKTETRFVCRLSSEFIRPIMDNLFLDIYHFFVPYRLVFDDTAAVYGENKSGAWAPSVDTEFPTLPTATVSEHTVADYLGLPLGQLPANTISLMPFRAFALVYDEWFRDENIIDPMNVQKGAAVSSESLNSGPWAPNNYTGLLPNVAKMHDYFTSCLPSPQKGDAVSLPLTGNAPIVADSTWANVTKQTDGSNSIIPVITQKYSVFDEEHIDQSAGSAEGMPSMINNTLGQGGMNSGNGGVKFYTYQLNGLPASYSDDYHLGVQAPDSQGVGIMRAYGPSETESTKNLYPIPTNLYADLGTSYADMSSVSAVTVNDLRFAFQYQKLLEKDARGGTRFTEYLLSHFGVRASDYRLQRSEYLGGRRIPLNVIQVAQTTGAGSSSSPLGSLGAYSQSQGRTRFTKSFEEPGYILTVACVRQFHTYQQGVDKMWTRVKRTDFYDPVFANIGEQPVYKTELYASSNADDYKVPFGYQEAWADYRSRRNRVSGQMRSNAGDTLSPWIMPDYYASSPTLSKSFIEESPVNLDKVISVESSSQDQFIFDFYLDWNAYRVMPTYSVPGLVDHH